MDENTRDKALPPAVRLNLAAALRLKITFRGLRTQTFD